MLPVIPHESAIIPLQSVTGPVVVIIFAQSEDPFIVTKNYINSLIDILPKYSSVCGKAILDLAHQH